MTSSPISPISPRDYDYNNLKPSMGHAAGEPEIPQSITPIQKTPEQIVLEQLNSVKVLKEIQQIASESGPMTRTRINLLRSLLAKVPASMQPANALLPNQYRAFAEDHLNRMGITASQDLGGHGGTFLAKITLADGTVHSLFLKPKDDIEYQNYQLIKHLSPDLLEFMPKVYGEVQIEGQKYIVMENTRSGSDGTTLQQLADVKLAGKLRNVPDFNPIADQNEMVVTRGKEKGYLDYKQQQIGAESAPGYMVAWGEKYLRMFNYVDSKENLLSTLEGTTPDQLNGLYNSLRLLSKTLIDSNIALIGASIILIKQQDGSIKPLLIDPAHMIVDPQQRNEVAQNTNIADANKVYYGDNRKFAQWKLSNQTGAYALLQTIDAHKTHVLGRATLSGSSDSESGRGLTSSDGSA